MESLLIKLREHTPNESPITKDELEALKHQSERIRELIGERTDVILK